MQKHRSAKVEVPDLITVPNLPEQALVNLARTELDLSLFDRDYAKYRFSRGEQGKTFEVKCWKPEKELRPSPEVRTWFKDGFVGNTSAFIAWIARNNPSGYYVTLPDDRDLYAEGHRLSAPCYIHKRDRIELCLYNGIEQTWGDVWTYVAFRKFR